MADKRLLLIEDEPHIAEAIRFLLQRAGWLVSIEADGTKAIGRIRGMEPDLVVLDLMLPGRSGLEILGEMRADQRLARTPVLMLTARGQERDREAAEQAGATAFLAKPFANADLIAAVAAMPGAA